MRGKGKITHWNGEKGFGFITPEAGAKQVFVHISAFSNRSVPPGVGQIVTFTLSQDNQGRPRAVDVARAGERPPKKPRRGSRSTTTRNAVFALLIGLLIVAVAYSKYQKSQGGAAVPFKAFTPESSPPSTSNQFRCDGRTHCSHMTSCEEAFFFIQNCPNTWMDGDHDGVPCESQWC